MADNRISRFLDRHFLHFNAAALVDAASTYKRMVESGNNMMIALAGAMSTAEIGISLAEMIRRDKTHIISCTGANLEEDLMNLVAHDHYKRIPNYRELTPSNEVELLELGLNRVTDTCIPEEQAFRVLEKQVLELWKEAEKDQKRYFPHEFLYQLINSDVLENNYQIDPDDSWMVAAARKNLPMVVPGWEDSTLGNIFTAYCIKGELSPQTMKTGIEYMMWLADWYKLEAGGEGVGFFQIGGGIAGDFPICVVPMMSQDLGWASIPTWNYFCQISDSTTSYGSYSGAAPNEKITWGKLSPECPKYVIESDATIVAPLMFAYILDW